MSSEPKVALPEEKTYLSMKPKTPNGPGDVNAGIHILPGVELANPSDPLDKTQTHEK